MKKMSELEKDALNEITNIFSYRSSIALEKLIKGNVELSVNNKQIVSLGGLEYSQKSPLMYLGIYSNIRESNLKGNVLLAFPKESALYIYDRLVDNESSTTKIVDDDVKNVLGEVGNVVTGNILGVLNKLLGIDCMHTIPSVVPSFGEQLYDFVYFDVEEDKKKAILVEVDTTFKLDDMEIKGESILLLTHDSFENLLIAIKEKAGEIK
ncbi:MAG: chemotaxis protein CheC [Candidatus Nanoarchaeia archaeon]